MEGVTAQLSRPRHAGEGRHPRLAFVLDTE
jgi:hypothetical protein